MAMVGWSRKARESREREARYRAWYSGLTPAQRAKEDEAFQRSQRNMLRFLLIWTLVGGLVILVVSFWPPAYVPIHTLTRPAIKP